jgi:hypothetical protein
MIDKLTNVFDKNMTSHLNVLQGIESGINEFRETVGSIKPKIKRKYGLSDEDIEKMKDMKI